jgi:hypothetical protein
VTKYVEIANNILPISKQNLLRGCAYIGNIESYKLLCLYYPLPEQIVEVDTELWLNQQIMQPEDAVPVDSPCY